MRSASLLRKVIPATLLCAALALGDYKSEPAGAPPPEVAPAIAQSLQKAGNKITNDGKPYAEIWLRSQKPSGGKPDEANVTLPAIPVGALLGVIRFDAPASDRRGQSLKAGVYTLRYGLMPVNGDHQGAAPQRDFLVLIPAADDTDPSAMPTFDKLVEMSKKASGTPHPAVLSFYKADAGTQPGMSQAGESDWVLTAKIGETAVSIIVAGTASV